MESYTLDAYRPNIHQSATESAGTVVCQFIVVQSPVVNSTAELYPSADFADYLSLMASQF